MYHIILPVLSLLLAAAVYAETPSSSHFDRHAYSPDSSLEIVSEGELGMGTSHGAKKVRIIWNSEMDSEPWELVHSEQSGHFPIFDRILEIDSFPKVYLALGWSSGGGGYQGFTAWLIRCDQIIRVQDYLEITVPRGFPGIDFNSTNGSIAILGYPDWRNVCGNSDNGAGAFTGQDIRQDFCKHATAAKLKGSWVPYIEHPFAQKRKAEKIRVIGLAKVSKTGFSFAP
jgi:hypothetical protein